MRAEAWFLLLLGAVGWLFVIGVAREQLLTKYICISSFSAFLTLLFFLSWFRLRKVFEVSKRDEEAFRQMLK